MAALAQALRRAMAWWYRTGSTSCARSVGAPHDAHLHFGATSQDVLDTSLVLRLKPIVEILDARLAALDARLAEMSRNHGGQALMGPYAHAAGAADHLGR